MTIITIITRNFLKETHKISNDRLAGRASHYASVIFFLFMQKLNGFIIFNTTRAHTQTNIHKQIDANARGVAHTN